MELVTIAELIRELNTAIVDVVPIDLSKDFINAMGNAKYITLSSCYGLKIMVINNT